MTGTKRRKRDLPRRRPAETATALVGGVVALLALLDVEVSTEAVAAIVAGIGALPAIVTAITDRLRRT